MDGVLNPIYIKLGQRYSMGTIPKNRNASEAKVVLSPQGKGSIKGVYFRGIHVREAGPVASMVFGSPEHEIEQLVFRDVHVQCRPLSDGRSSNPPDWSPNGYPCAVSTAGKDGTLVCGFHFRHVWDLLLDNVKVEPGAGDGRELIECVDVEGFRQANAFC